MGRERSQSNLEIIHMFAKKRSLGIPGLRFRQGNNESLDTLQMSLLFAIVQYIFPAGHVEEGGGMIKAKLV